MTCLTSRLAALAETPIAPAWAAEVASGQRAITAREQKQLTQLYARLTDESTAARATAERLVAIAPAWPRRRRGSGLL